jgi:hypothetical protein
LASADLLVTGGAGLTLRLTTGSSGFAGAMFRAVPTSRSRARFGFDSSHIACIDLLL